MTSNEYTKICQKLTKKLIEGWMFWVIMRVHNSAKWPEGFHVLFVDCHKEKLSNMSAMQDGMGRVGKGSLGLPTAPPDGGRRLTEWVELGHTWKYLPLGLGYEQPLLFDVRHTSQKKKISQKNYQKEGTAHSLLSVMTYGHHCAQSLHKDLKPKISFPKPQLSK